MRRDRPHSRPGRQGTRALRSRRTRSASSTASNACRLPWMSETIATRISTVSLVTRSSRHRDRRPTSSGDGGRRRCQALACAAGRGDRAGAGGPARVLHKRADRPRFALRPAAAGARAGSGGGRPGGYGGPGGSASRPRRSGFERASLAAPGGRRGGSRCEPRDWPHRPDAAAADALAPAGDRRRA